MKFILPMIVGLSVFLQAQNPVLSSVTPNTVTAEASSATLLLSGSNFSLNGTVGCGARGLPFTFLSTVSGQVTLPSYDLPTGRTLLLLGPGGAIRTCGDNISGQLAMAMSLRATSSA
ncbi:MAG: hypothetical protein EXS14_03870 [Planctomycetes bacterium]|nr:hypothetical protein [Planctomycetota bacterium]